MSTNQRVRRNASPSTKQGPIKATKAFPSSSVGTRSPTRAHGSYRSSPVSSPILVANEHFKSSRQSPERSSNSPNFKVEKPKPLRPSSGPNLKRAGSLDTIDRYLTGHWPREPSLSQGYQNSQAAYEVFMVDKSTQAPDEDTDKSTDHKRSSSLGSGEQLKKEFIKRLQRSKDSNRPSDYGKSRQSPVPGSHAALTTPPPSSHIRSILIPSSSRVIPPRHPRSSVEGLNPEIEKLVLHTISDEDRNPDIIPDGHRAPFPDTPRTLSSRRTVDTQTPSSVSIFVEDTIPLQENRSDSISPAIPIMPGLMDSSRPSSRTDSTDSLTAVTESPDLSAVMPKYTTSPRPNNSYSFVREPPDGCEKVKVCDETRRPQIKEPLLLGPIETNSFILKPSDRSAFLPLPRTCLGAETHHKSSSPATFVQPIETQ